MRILAGLAALALACGPAFCQAKRGKESKPPPPRAPKTSAPRPNAPPKQQQPARELDRLEHLSPQQRKEMLDRLPPNRARKLQERFDEYKQLTPEQRGRLQQQYDQFKQLPPARQEAIRWAYQRFDGLPQERQAAVRQEFNALHRMSDDNRRERLNSPEFRSKFNKDEQKLIDEMAKAVPQ